MTPADLYKQDGFQQDARAAAALVIGSDEVVFMMAQRGASGDSLRIESYRLTVPSARKVLVFSGAPPGSAALLPEEGSFTRPLFVIVGTDDHDSFTMVVYMMLVGGAWQFDAEDFGIVAP